MSLKNSLLICSLCSLILCMSSCEGNTPNVKLENGHEYVDLGLSVKWATCNLGAQDIDDPGHFYAWGETSHKGSYEWSTYIHGTGKNDLYTYTYQSGDSVTTLQPEDDAAYVLLGGKWRMPSIEEFEELRTKCTWKWAQIKNTMGYYITGPNGNSIFLPAGGFQDETHQVNKNLYGYYWSSTLDTTNVICARSLDFVTGNVNCSSSSRFYGQSVRGVIP